MKTIILTDTQTVKVKLYGRDENSKLITKYILQSDDYKNVSILFNNETNSTQLPTNVNIFNDIYYSVVNFYLNIFRSKRLTK